GRRHVRDQAAGYAGIGGLEPGLLRLREVRTLVGADPRDGAKDTIGHGCARGVPSPPVPINPADPVAELVELGRHAAAAELAAGRGEHLRAAELYERIWDFRAAAHCRQLGGDLPGALRCAL